MTHASLLTLAAMLCAGIPGLAGADTAGKEKWSRYAEDREGIAFYDPASVVREGQRVHVRIRVVPTLRSGDEPHFYIAERAVDCAAQTMALLSAAEYGAGPEPRRSVTVPADRTRYEPVFSDGSDAALYERLCPRGKPLPRFQPGAPPIAVTPTP